MYIILYYSDTHVCMLLNNIQGVSYSHKSHSKCSFPNLVDHGTSQFRSHKYLTGYQNVKKVKSEFES